VLSPETKPHVIAAEHHQDQPGRWDTEWHLACEERLL
jgi:hypothetical protein